MAKVIRPHIDVQKNTVLLCKVRGVLHQIGIEGWHSTQITKVEREIAAKGFTNFVNTRNKTYEQIVQQLTKDMYDLEELEDEE